MQAHHDDQARKTLAKDPGAPDPADGRRTFIRLLSASEVEALRKGR